MPGCLSFRARFGRPKTYDPWCEMIQKHSITIRGHRTSLSLEDEFWRGLRLIADQRGQTLAALIGEIDETRGPQDNLSSAARIFVLRWLTSGGHLESDARAQPTDG